MRGTLSEPTDRVGADRQGRPKRAAWATAAAGGAAVAVLALAGCAVTPPGPATAPAAPAAPAAEAADPAVGRPSALMIERQWLQSWFNGTPVRISQRGDGPLDVAVPLEFCFEPGRSQVRPALAAVLDKLAESLRRVPSARLARIAAPGDGRQANTLAAQRGARVRSHLLSRGVAAGQLGAPTVGSAPELQLRMSHAGAP